MHKDPESKSTMFSMSFNHRLSRSWGTGSRDGRSMEDVGSGPVGRRDERLSRRVTEERGKGRVKRFVRPRLSL